MISAPTTRNHGACGEIPRAHGMRPYIHVNRSPNDLRKPSSDLKLIALTKVSERSKRIVVALPPNGRTYPLSFGHLPVLQGVTRSAAGRTMCAPTILIRPQAYTTITH